MAGLNPETVTIEVGEESFELVPCSGALIGISQATNGPLGAIERLRGMDVVAAAAVIGAGAELTPQQVKALPDKIFDAGVLDTVCADAVRFCMLLMRGGKPEKKAPATAPKAKPGNEKKPAS